MHGMTADGRHDADHHSPSQNLEELAKLTGELAHEIKSPLSVIKLNLKLIQEVLQEVEASQSRGGRDQNSAQGISRAIRKLNVIDKEADRLERILEGFLRYVGQPELQLAVVDVNELVGDMVDFYLPQARKYSITVRHCLTGGPLLCRIDVGMLKQVLLNLFVNAQQAMDQGGELMIRTAKQGDRATIEVSDTGRGIEAGKLGVIFKPYYSARPGGTGLGLATAKKIVEAHRGSIAVHSEPGIGTCFTISLPMEQNHCEGCEPG